ncbi:hypothetical protein Tco_1123632 [Tanacetum coccineum]|uniref:Uncharacterized protein n=1 Tax=Tanacetum coccineum TaxID=301880 RepID=A0ABQ5J6Q2_9ASTR
MFTLITRKKKEALITRQMSGKRSKDKLAKVKSMRNLRMNRLRELTNQQQEQESTEEEWENIRARVKDDEELSRRLQAEERNKILEGRASELAAGSSQATIIDSTEVESSKKNAEVELYHEEQFQWKKFMLKPYKSNIQSMPGNLVKERFSSTEPTDDKERALWVELKRLFEPNTDDTLWKLHRYIADYEIENI